MEDLAYYKYVTVTDFIEKNASKEGFLNNKYNNMSMLKTYKFLYGLLLACAITASLNTSSQYVRAPYLLNYIILYYSTLRNKASNKYEFDEIEKVCEDLNQGGLNEIEHFF